MQYPKPLSEKTLKKRYAEAHLTDEQNTFLHHFCLAACHLYGAVNAQSLWKVYTELKKKTDVVEMTPQNLYDGCAILRREDVPYCIFEADEIFGGESPKPDKQMLVSKELIGRGFGKYDQIYRLFENEEYVGFYVPENYLDYREEQISQSEQMLVNFLSELEVTKPLFLVSNGKQKPVSYRGKKLKSFSFEEGDLSDSLDIDSEVFGQVRGNIARHAFALEEDLKTCTAAERLVYSLKYEIRMGDIPFTDIIQDLLQHLAALGVELTDDEYSILFELTHDTISQIHLWCRSGWQAEALSRRAHNDS